MPPQDETAFQRWYAEASKRYDLNPDPDSADQFYDYRAAFRAGAKPDPSGHWPSDFKKAGHPNMVVGGFNVKTGERVAGTPRASEPELVSLGWDAATAKRLAAMPDQDVVIVGSDGVEHVFPPGFDPKRAASIVRRSSTTTPAEPERSGDISSPLNMLGIQVVDQQKWDSLTPKERLRGVLKAFGRAALSMGGMVDPDSREGVIENPGTTLAAAAIPAGLGAVGRSALPYAAPAARAAASALNNPAVSSAVGAGVGYYHGGVKGAAVGAVTGAVTGAAAGTRVARGLNRVANRLDPPAPRVSPNARASQEMIAGMGRSAERQPAPTPAVAPSAAPVEPAVSTPAPPAPPAGPVAAESAATRPAGSPRKFEALDLKAADRTQGQMSRQWVSDDVALAARRSGRTLSVAQKTEAAALVRAGTHSPREAVESLASAQAPAVAAPKRLKLSGEETRAYVQLRSAGKSHQEAADLIEAQRLLTQSFGTPTADKARKAVAERNATGRWKKDR